MAAVGLLKTNPNPSERRHRRGSWTATSAAAAPIRASSRPCAWPRSACRHDARRQIARGADDDPGAGTLRARGAAPLHASSSSAATSCACSAAASLVMVAASDLLAQESGARGRRGAATRPSSPPGCTSTRAGAVHGLHRQGRDRPEHPHVAGADGRRRAARAARVDHAGDGRHRPDAVRQGHVRIADDAADGAAAREGRRDGARDADRSGGRALAGRSRDADRARRPRSSRGDGRALALRRADQGPEAHRDDSGRPPRRSARRVEGRAARAAKKVDGRAFVTGQPHTRPTSCGRACCYGRIVRPRLRRHARSASTTRAREAMAGVTVVRDGDFLGVVAPTERGATRAAAAVQRVERAAAGSRRPRRSTTT